MIGKVSRGCCCYQSVESDIECQSEQNNNPVDDKVDDISKKRFENLQYLGGAMTLVGGVCTFAFKEMAIRIAGGAVAFVGVILLGIGVEGVNQQD